MTAFVTSLIFAIAGDVAIVWYSRRRQPGARITWGEAMLAATFAFVMFNLWYGVVPHQWITLADNEWRWRADRLVAGPWGILEANRFLPFTITYVVLRDLVVLAIYGVGLTLHVWHWAQWQDRAKPKPVVEPTTTYGRPLARRS